MLELSTLPHTTPTTHISNSDAMTYTHTYLSFVLPLPWSLVFHIHFPISPIPNPPHLRTTTKREKVDLITRLHLPSRFKRGEAECYEKKEAGQTLFACLPSVFCLAQLPCVRSSPTAARARPDPTLVTCLITWLSRVRGKKVLAHWRGKM